MSSDTQSALSYIHSELQKASGKYEIARGELESAEREMCSRKKAFTKLIQRYYAEVTGGSLPVEALELTSEST